MSMTTTNPATDEALSTYEAFDHTQVTSAIEMADAQHHVWKRQTFDERATVLREVAKVLDSRADQLATLMANEMGKPVSQGRSEVEKCAWACRHYADNAESYLADGVIETDHEKSYTHCEPLGVVLAVMPWNFPLWQVVRFAAPALMAGNACLLKHATNVTGSALALEDVFLSAGLPEGLFRTLVVSSARVDGILEHELVRAVTLTGSGPAGAAVAAKAGSLLKKSVLELGGSDPYIVLEDADLDHAASVCASSRMTNGGQSCIAAKRFIALDAVYDDFVERLAEEMAAMTMGDPHDSATDYGPQARADLRDELHEQVQASVSAGARVITGGEVPERDGAWYPATVLADVTSDMAVYTQETFGPVAAVIRAADEQDALRIANDTDFGLGAAVFTADHERGENIARTEINAGSCFVNTAVASDPRLPFGGIKQSGYGRELADLGIREFVNVKTIVVG